jgi:hypothetical protein
MRIQDDRAIRICRIIFVAWVAAVLFAWPGLGADDRFWAIGLSVLALFIVSSATLDSLCTKLACLGGVAILVGLFTLITGYEGGRGTVHTVERSSAVMPLAAGILFLVVALTSRRLL